MGGMSPMLEAFVRSEAQLHGTQCLSPSNPLLHNASRRFSRFRGLIAGKSFDFLGTNSDSLSH
jgi:hypothetical protein